MTDAKTPYIVTYTGWEVDLANPKPDDVHIVDIATALSRICRYTGHLDYHYSVAQHSVYVSEMTGTLEGLMHDAHEAYVGDVSSPLKKLLPDYAKIEEKHRANIAQVYDLPLEMSRECHEADMQMLANESLTFFERNFAPDYKPTRLDCVWSPELARQKFLDVFDTLSRSRRS